MPPTDYRHFVESAGWWDGFRVALSGVLFMPYWRVKALIGRIRHRKDPEAFDGYKVTGLK
jgi:hypothetical protein